MLRPLRAAALIPCALLAGCFSAVRKQPYMDVASAALSAGADAKASYQAAQDEYYDEQMDELAADYAAKGYAPGRVSALIASGDLRAREDAIDLVEDYGRQIERALQPRKLAESSGKPAKDSGSSSGKGKKGGSAFSKTLSPADAQLIGTAISEIGRLLADDYAARHMRKAVRRADPHIQTLCGLLAEDIGERDGIGIRSEVWETYGQRIVLQNEFVKANWQQMDAVSRRAEIVKLAALEKEQGDADASLAKTADELRRVAALNHRLAAKGK